SVAATVATAFEAGLVNGKFTVTRTGDTTSNLAVTYTVSGTATPGADYLMLSGAVTIPAGASSADIIVTPIDDLLVEPDETVVLTISPSPTYAVVFPSSATVTIVSDDVPPDLVVTAISVPTVAGAGTTITVTDTTTNSGTGASGPSTTGFYLSVNGIIDSTDPLIGTRDVPALGAGTPSSGSAMLTIPANTSVGSYVIIAKADVNNMIVETREDNNTRISGTIRIGPDLVGSSLTTPSSADLRSTIT